MSLNITIGNLNNFITSIFIKYNIIYIIIVILIYLYNYTELLFFERGANTIRIRGAPMRMVSHFVCMVIWFLMLTDDLIINTFSSSEFCIRVFQ